MTENDAGRRLAEMYSAALPNEKVLTIHLFGIAYANQLIGLSLAKVVEIANLPKSYVAEVNKGRNLARYVQLKSN